MGAKINIIYCINRISYEHSPKNSSNPVSSFAA
jgi:hypothetical protein